MLQGNDPHGHVLRLVRVERGDEFAGGADVVVVIRDDDLVGLLVQINDGFVRERRADPVLHVRRLNVLQRKNLHQPLPAFRHVRLRAAQQFGTHPRLLVLRHDQNGIAEFNRRIALQRQRAVNKIDGLAWRYFFGTGDGQLALHLRMLQHALAGRLREPLHNHVNVRSLEAQLNPVRRIGAAAVQIGGRATCQRSRGNPRPAVLAGGI